MLFLKPTLNILAESMLDPPPEHAKMVIGERRLFIEIKDIRSHYFSNAITVNHSFLKGGCEDSRISNFGRSVVSAPASASPEGSSLLPFLSCPPPTPARAISTDFVDGLCQDEGGAMTPRQ